jgi:glycosyltransferase involved in cell wall biosynthesis
MKIVCISASQVPSSTANSIQAMKACQALAQLGHEVVLLVPGREKFGWEALAGHYGLITPFTVEWLPAQPRLKRYDFSLKAVRRASALKANLVYAWAPQAALIAGLQGLPVMLELHGEPEGKLGPLVLKSFLKLQGPKRLLPITQALQERIESLYARRFSPGEFVVVPNGVDLERYTALPAPENARHQLELEQTFTAGYTGHMYPGRGMGLLFDLARRFPQVQFLWVGGRREDVKTWQERLEKEAVKNVRLIGFVENSRLPLYQAAAEVLLMPYERRIEGSSGGNSADFCSPMKMFEYMAAGRAIITSDLPVIREVLNDTSAVFCPPEDLEAWSEALERLLVDPEDGLRLGRSVLDQIENYTWIERARRALEGFC